MDFLYAGYKPYALALLLVLAPNSSFVTNAIVVHTAIKPGISLENPDIYKLTTSKTVLCSL